MKKFAKIIELEEGQQVLLTIDYDQSEGSHNLGFRTEFEEGLVMKTTYTYGDDEEKAYKAMDLFTLEMAINIVNSVKKDL